MVDDKGDGFVLPRVWKNGLKIFGIMAAAIIGIYLCFKLAGFLLPFALAMIFAQLIEPLIRLFMKRTKMNRKYAVTVSSVIVVALFATIGTFLWIELANQASNLIENMPAVIENVKQWLLNLEDTLVKKLDILPLDALNGIESAIKSVVSSLGNASKGAAMGVLSSAISIPKAIIFIVITIVATVIFMRDRGSIYESARKHLPESLIDGAISIKKTLFHALFGYVKAQAKIMCIVFVEILVGLWLLQINYSLLLAPIIAIFDALPVFGAGLFLLPMALYMLFSGSYIAGLGLLALYICNIIIRQILEPRILGVQIGLHPLVTLISVYAGLQISGIIGMIGGPMLVLILKSILGAILKGKTLKEILYSETIFEKEEDLDKEVL